MLNLASLEQAFNNSVPLANNTGKQNQGIFINPASRVLFKLPRINASRSFDEAWAEGLHHQQVQQNLQLKNQDILPKFYGQWTDKTKNIVLAMEYLEKPSLLDLFQKSKVKASEVFNLYKSKILPIAQSLSEDGFYHADLNMGNVLIDKDGNVNIVDIEPRRTFLFKADEKNGTLTKLNALIARRKSVMYHIPKKELLKKIESEGLTETTSKLLKNFLDRLLLCDLKRSYIQFTLLREKDSDIKLLKSIKSRVYTWVNQPKSRWALELMNTLSVYQPFCNFDDYTLLKRLSVSTGSALKSRFAQA